MEDSLNFELCTIDDLRHTLGIGRNTAYALLKDGLIDAWKVGGHWKIPKASIEKYISEHISHSD